MFTSGIDVVSVWLKSTELGGNLSAFVIVGTGFEKDVAILSHIGKDCFILPLIGSGPYLINQSVLSRTTVVRTLHTLVPRVRLRLVV